METYDPLNAPDVEKWLETDESDRLLMAQDYHRRARTELPNAKVHAVVHVVVENQLAESITEVVEALDRLMAAGLDRHDALHAIGSVLAEHLFHGLEDGSGSDLNEPYLRDLEGLTAEKWLSSAE